MSSSLCNKDIERAIAFHGHVCPGLMIGIRAAEVCLKEFGHNDQEPLCCVCETDMCAVDAIQVLTGCTFGKGNLIHKDYGKSAFTFYRKSDGSGIRLLLERSTLGTEHAESVALMKKKMERTLFAPEEERLKQLRESTGELILKTPLETLFTMLEPQQFLPRPAKVLETLYCDACGEGIMESRSRRFDGQTLCIPCFCLVEQKL